MNQRYMYETTSSQKHNDESYTIKFQTAKQAGLRTLYHYSYLLIIISNV